MDFHPIANVFPMLPEGELAILAEDIKVNGLHHPVITFEGKILDGRNRYRACEMAGIKPSYKSYEGEDAIGFVVSENINRRHMDESQRAMCAARLANIEKHKHADASIEASISQPNAAERLNVSRPSVQRAKEVLKKGTPELVRAVDEGRVAVSRAAQIARLPEKEQTKITQRISEGETPHVAQNSGNNEWYTPEEYIRRTVAVMGAIDLDPASTATANKVVGASKFYTAEQDGLTKKWKGRVFMNPPYSSELIWKFIDKIIESDEVTEAIVLVNNATETKWFQAIAEKAKAICFPSGRVKFWNPEKESFPLQGQAVLYIGKHPDKFTKFFSDMGTVWHK